SAAASCRAAAEACASGVGLQGSDREKTVEGRQRHRPPDLSFRRSPGRQLLSAPPANGWVAVLAPEMTASTRGWPFRARSIDAFTARELKSKIFLSFFACQWLQTPTR